jgi:ribosomal protein S18 acetylase RimI-like enzyme
MRGFVLVSRRRQQQEVEEAVMSTEGEASLQQQQQQQQQQQVPALDLRIRRTREADLPLVASFLSTAIVETAEDETKRNDWMDNWRDKMDQLWAKADIEALLRSRYQAMEEGRKALALLNEKHQGVQDELDELQRLKLLWYSSERLRHHIEKAGKATGEANLWQRHNFAIAPADSSWFNHLQITAVDQRTNEVVGFCEVAMLSNPLAVQQEKEDDDGDGERVFSTSKQSSYRPSITNLATAPAYRRRGIASRLLMTAARYAQIRWKADSLGLYVEKANAAAVQLYQRTGYEALVTCTASEGGEGEEEGSNRVRTGDMWYMLRKLNESS